jgi:hypothetical protein
MPESHVLEETYLTPAGIYNGGFVGSGEGQVVAFTVSRTLNGLTTKSGIEFRRDERKLTRQGTILVFLGNKTCD